MQDIDFSRYYRRGRRPNEYSVSDNREKTGNFLPANKLSLYLAIAFSCLAIGFIGGTQLQKSKMTREIENKVVPESMATANVAEPSVETEKQMESVRVTRTEDKIVAENTVHEAKPNYLILAKIFPNEKEASLAGLGLKRNGYRAFMARNGKKIKLYVGPIEGKSEAYDALAKIKKNAEFSGAILYRK
ncbi:MAG TPA: SPOR domain-containing protein [Turneriella sp.]|nr:SPOR domain-containing protein [Turneriella sp.]